ncbi:hypothetical protein [Azospirillum doebereinerae]
MNESGGLDGDPSWRPAIDALAFHPVGHEGICAVHRLAFRALLGRAGTPADCLAYFAAHRPAFERAVAEKIARRGLSVAANLHLTSRDVERALEGS